MSIPQSTPNKWQQFQAYLFQPVDVSTLAIFRILFGALMVWEVYRYFYYDRVYRYYIEPVFYFPYEYFHFATPWPGDLMYLHFYAMGLFAVGIMLGFFYRVSAVGFFLTYTFAFLIDKTQHNNHYYLIVLISGLLMFVDAHRWLSVDRYYFDHLKQAVVPFWQQFVLRTQMVIVYFYAGVAKINEDWLQGSPVGEWIADKAHYPLETAHYYFEDNPTAWWVATQISDFFVSPIAPYFFAYGGLLFDLSIGFLLLWKRTRLLALFPMFFFHLMNKYLFNIGIFPQMALATTILFADPDWPRKLLRFSALTIPKSLPMKPLRQTIIASGVALYLAVQILVPLRHWLYPGNVAWNEEGHRFSWRMKLRSKDATIDFIMMDPESGEEWVIDMDGELNSRQISKMATRPDMIYHYAQHLKWVAHEIGIEKPIIRAESWASLNERQMQRFIDPEANLAEVDYYYSLFSHADWILPLQPRVIPTPEAGN